MAGLVQSPAEATRYRALSPLIVSRAPIALGPVMAGFFTYMFIYSPKANTYRYKQKLQLTGINKRYIKTHMSLKCFPFHCKTVSGSGKVGPLNP